MLPRKLCKGRTRWGTICATDLNHQARELRLPILPDHGPPVMTPFKLTANFPLMVLVKLASAAP
eukprot:16439650-Heterocapsa_arctica.AAC.1